MIVFFNTYKPVVSLFEKILPALNSEGLKAIAFISSKNYRESGDKGNNQYISYSENINLRHEHKLVTILKYMIDSFVFIIKKKPTYCVFLTQPPMFYAVVSILCRFMNIKYSIHVMDMYPDILFKYKMIHEKSVIGKTLSALSLIAYKHSDKIIVLSSCMYERMVKKGVQKNKIEIIRNWAHNECNWIPRNENKFLIENQLLDKKIVLYSGNMGIAHHFDTILNVAKKLKQMREDIIFIFIGSGDKKKHIIDYVNTHNLSNVKFLPFQDEMSLPHLLSAATVHYFSLNKDFTGTLLPSKFYGMLAAQRPIIFEGSMECEIAKVLIRCSCGKSVPQNDFSNLMDCIIEFCDDEEYSNHMGLNAYDYYKKYASSKLQINKYLKLIHSLV